jgi:hypothetical protein
MQLISSHITTDCTYVGSKHTSPVRKARHSNATTRVDLLLFVRRDDWGSNLRNIGQYLPDYAAQHPWK